MAEKKSKIDKDFEELMQGEGEEFAQAMGIDELLKLAMPRYNTLVELGDGVIIDLASIVRIDKDRRFLESMLGNSRFQFGIVINKDVVSKDYPNHDVYIWYEREDARDTEHANLCLLLQQNGRQIVTKSVNGKLTTVVG